MPLIPEYIGNAKTITPVKPVKNEVSVKVMEFDPELLPESFRPWITDIAERMQCPTDIPAVASMAVLASVVGRQVAIRPKCKDNWEVIPNLWGVAIGRPGLMKSPPVREVMKPLQRLEIKAAKEYAAAENAYRLTEATWKAQHRTAEDSLMQAVKKGTPTNAVALPEKPAMPIRRRYVTNDSTVEKLGEILAGNPHGVLQFRDELMGLLKNLDKPGKESDRAFYIEGWSGDGRFTSDRIGRGTIDIEACCVSIFATTQPGPLSSYLFQAKQGGGGDDGLVQRFQLMVWPEVSKQWKNVDRWPDKKSRDNAHDVIERLANIDPWQIDATEDEFGGIPFLRFSADAQGRFDGWRADLEQEVRSGELPPSLEAHLSKYRSLIPSLALLIHLADGRQGPVGLSALDKAVGWGEYLRSHAEKIYGSVDGGESASDQELESFIRSKGGRVTVPEVRSKFKGDSEAAKEKLQSWVKLGKGRWDIPPSGPLGGRQPTRFVLGNGEAKTITPEILEENEGFGSGFDEIDAVNHKLNAFNEEDTWM
jgi:hypothetical protein